ncbi:3216_t:CDS:1, partial [Ambispora gerdemannii]
MSQKDSVHSFESAIAKNSSNNNKQIEVERPSTPTNTPDRNFYNLKKKIEHLQLLLKDQTIAKNTPL